MARQAIGEKNSTFAKCNKICIELTISANFATKTFAIEKKDAFSREKTFATEEK